METFSNCLIRQTRKRKYYNNYSPQLPRKRVASEGPMERVLGIELLLETILEKLGPEDLKHSRQVNKEWHFRSTKILLQNPSFKVALTFQHEPNKNDKLKLIELTETMERTRKLNLPFPSSSFAFDNFDLSIQQLQRFLSKCGHKINSLDICFGHSNAPYVKQVPFLHRFKKLVLDQLPNIQTLAIASKMSALLWYICHNTSGEGTKNLASASYPKLKTLQVMSELPKHVFEFLIKAGGNIQNIELGRCLTHDHEHLVEVLRRANKTHLLTSTFVVLRQNNLDLIEHLGKAECNLKLLNLFLDPSEYSHNYWPRALKIISTLLNACTKSLEMLRAHPFCVFPEFHIPIMPRLQTLSILVPQTCQQTFLPTKTFKISRVFPRLSLILLTYQSNVSNITSEQLYGNSFLGADYEDAVSSVDTLQFEKEPELHCIQGFPRLFTNLKRIKIWDLSNVSDILEAVWALPVVEVVFFSISVQTLSTLQITSLNRNAFTTTALDSALTGISQEMRDCIPEELDAAAIDNLRVRKSMLDAKCLRQMIIRINDDSITKRTSPAKTILSKIARKYAFDMCPQVEVGIILVTKHQENLEYLTDRISPVLNTKEKKMSSAHYNNYLPKEPTLFAKLHIV